jgi:glycosyltransferase involved in cell wall biosynthesis
LFAGSKSREKGVFDLLEAARRLADSKGIQFVAIGPQTAEWAAATKSGLPPNFSDRGFVPEEEKQRLFARCDIFALPSRVESFGLVYGEAWKHGKPVIGADIPAARDVIRHNVDGLLSPFGDVDALTSALRRLASDADLRRRLGKAGLDRLRAGLSPAHYLDRLESAFRSIVCRVQPASLPDTQRV